ncbi:MAG: hypothetical protein ABJ275_02260 [Maricaulaceae bacterium]
MTPHILQYIGAVLAMLVGLNGLFRPLHMGKLVGLTPTTKVGLVEIRVLFGSFLVTLPLLAILSQKAEIFEFFGMAALAAAIIKTLFTLLDKCPIKLIWFGIAVDIVLALLLLSTLYL